MSIQNLPPLRDIIARHQLLAKKSLGQNFLLDPNLTAKIARAAGNLEGRNIIEIGPGPGGLTRSLLATDATQVFAVEKDERCLAALAELQEVAGGRLTILHGDALEVDVTAQVPAPRKIVANLPYNVATPLLFGWLAIIERDPAAFESLTLMFQKEVAERITAQPGCKDYGRVSVISQWLCDTHMMFDIPPEAFTPAPKVTSTVVNFIPRAKKLAEADKDALEKVVAAAFGQRRKMLRAALKGLTADPLALLEKAGIDATKRAEQLSVEEFCALARSYSGKE